MNLDIGVYGWRSFGWDGRAGVGRRWFTFHSIDLLNVYLSINAILTVKLLCLLMLLAVFATVHKGVLTMLSATAPSCCGRWV